MPRMVPYYAPIWETIRFDRGLAVRELLKSFRSSPFDIRHDGTTLLYVSNHKFSTLRIAGTGLLTGPRQMRRSNC